MEQLGRTGTPFREASGHPTRLSREVEVKVEVERRSGTVTAASSPPPI